MAGLTVKNINPPWTVENTARSAENAHFSRTARFGLDLRSRFSLVSAATRKQNGISWICSHPALPLASYSGREYSTRLSNYEYACFPWFWDSPDFSELLVLYNTINLVDFEQRTFRVDANFIEIKFEMFFFGILGLLRIVSIHDFSLWKSRLEETKRRTLSSKARN